MKQIAAVAVEKSKSILSQLRDVVPRGPKYRIVNLEKDTNDEYIATIQIIGKSLTFSAKPEDILANDSMIDLFAPRDVRTLTYLGYLGMHSPKYQILAKRLSEDSDKMLFAIKKKGTTNIEVKTAIEISTDKELLKNLRQEDAHMIGHATAMENILEEKAMKKKLLENIKHQE